MGFVLTSTLSEAAMQSWGWRVAFGVGGLLGLVGLWLRVSVEETESFRDAHAEGRTTRRNPLVGMLVEHPRAALRVVGITIAGTLIYYVWVSYMPGLRAHRDRHPAERGAAGQHDRRRLLPVPAAVRGAAVGPVRPQADAARRSPSGSS